MRQDSFPGTSGTLKNLSEYKETRKKQRDYGTYESFDIVSDDFTQNDFNLNILKGRSNNTTPNIPQSQLLKQLETGNVPNTR